MVTKYGLQRMPGKIVIWTDSDYAGCTKTRKSTSGGVVMFGGHCLKTWSSTQDVVALSSGEAEYYALVKAVSQGIGMKNLLQDLGVDVEIAVRTDASRPHLSMADRLRFNHQPTTSWQARRTADGDLLASQKPALKADS